MSEGDFSTFFEFLKQSPPRDSRAFSALAAGPRLDCVACDGTGSRPDCHYCASSPSGVHFLGSNTAHVKSRISASAGVSWSCEKIIRRSLGRIWANFPD